MSKELQNGQHSNLPDYVREFQEVMRPNTYTDLITCKSAKLRPFAAKYGNKALEDILMGVLSGLSEGLGLSVSAVMLSDAATLIIQEYPDTKLSDFLLFKNEMLLGRIGGQIGDQLWKWNTRTITLAWAEYYEKREDAFSEHREHQNDEYKHQYKTGLARAFANASPESRELIKSTADKLDRLVKSKRISADRDRPVPIEKMELHEVCAEKGIPYDRIFNIVAEKCRQEFNEDIGISFETFLALRLKAVLFSVRKDENYLETLIDES